MFLWSTMLINISGIVSLSLAEKPIIAVLILFILLGATLTG